jgi:hypothetical protein
VRRSLPLLILLLTSVTACSQANDSTPSGSDGESVTVANAAADSALPTELSAPPSRASRETGPDIRPDNAPGVAFNYRYAFRLESERVAEAQQEHQRLCERYGVSRCRITGMTYRAANAEDVEAMLALRVDPAIAGQFGRESVQAVLNADGALADSEISGTDVGSQLQSSGRSLAELTARLNELEARIRRAGNADKGMLEAEAESLRQQISALRSTREGQHQALTTTPMVFRYGSGDLAPGPAQPTTLREALADTGDDFLASLTFLLVVLVRLLPWFTAALLIWGVLRFVRRRFGAPPAPEPAEPALGI